MDSPTDREQLNGDLETQMFWLLVRDPVDGVAGTDTARNGGEILEHKRTDTDLLENNM